MVMQKFFIQSFFLMQFFAVVSLNDLQVNNGKFACINKFMVGKILAVDIYFSALVLSQFIFSCSVAYTRDD